MLHSCLGLQSKGGEGYSGWGCIKNRCWQGCSTRLLDSTTICTRNTLPCTNHNLPTREQPPSGQQQNLRGEGGEVFPMDSSMGFSSFRENMNMPIIN